MRQNIEPIDLLDVSISFYRDVGGRPSATPVCDFPGLTDSTFDFAVFGNHTIPLPFPCTLVPGVYWMAQQVTVEFPSETPHEWVNRSSQAGNPAVWRNPNNGFVSNCVDWTPLDTCGVGGGQPDLTFEISGVVLPAPTMVPGLAPLGFIAVLIALVGIGRGLVVRRRVGG